MYWKRTETGVSSFLESPLALAISTRPSVCEHCMSQCRWQFLDKHLMLSAISTLDRQWWDYAMLRGVTHLGQDLLLWYTCEGVHASHLHAVPSTSYSHKAARLAFFHTAASMSAFLCHSVSAACMKASTAGTIRDVPRSLPIYPGKLKESPLIHWKDWWKGTSSSSLKPSLMYTAYSQLWPKIHIETHPPLFVWSPWPLHLLRARLSSSSLPKGSPTWLLHHLRTGTVEVVNFVFHWAWRILVCPWLTGPPSRLVVGNPWYLLIWRATCSKH